MKAHLEKVGSDFELRLVPENVPDRVKLNELHAAVCETEGRIVEFGGWDFELKPEGGFVSLGFIVK